MNTHEVWRKIPTKVYQALHPEHFSRSCVERRAGTRKGIAGGELYVISTQLNSLIIKYGKPTKP